jgi:hypothetical protein
MEAAECAARFQTLLLLLFPDPKPSSITTQSLRLFRGLLTLQNRPAKPVIPASRPLYKVINNAAKPLKTKHMLPCSARQPNIRPQTGSEIAPNPAAKTRGCVVPNRSDEDLVKSTKNRAATIPATSRQRSATTNGKRMFVDGNGRGAWARRWRDLKSLYQSDLSHQSLSEFQLGLISTAATLRCELERLEGQLSLGEKVDIDLYSRIAGHYRRIAETLGLERNMRDITPVPTVEAYIEHRRKEREAAEAAAKATKQREPAE